MNIDGFPVTSQRIGLTYFDALWVQKRWRLGGGIDAYYEGKYLENYGDVTNSF